MRAIWVWAVLKPGFLAMLKDPFDTMPLDIIVFDVLPASDGNGEGRVSLANEIKDPGTSSSSSFWVVCGELIVQVSCGTRSIQLRSKSNAKVKDWVAAINDAGLRPPEGWCHPHRFGSFAPPRGLTDDGSQAQWFVDGQAAFEAIAVAIEEAKSEIFICGWWLCPELYLRRSFHAHVSSRLDALLEAKAKQGVQRNKAPYEQAIPLLMPQHHMVIPHYMSESREMDVQINVGNDHKDIKRQDSFSSRSSYQDVPLLIPQEAEGLDFFHWTEWRLKIKWIGSDS
ncbi:phospholipase D P1 [Actinidia rufa]|uniref:Phospholipase D P1 n=1 Tax=Actinidia rufa TaxID=165716 RepID=A0A7J0GT68_9ERIC|nr:phospholipase D P1 [Actinidia rufa]